MPDLPTSSPSIPPTPPSLVEGYAVIPVIKETATVGREVVETGRVRLTKTVEEHEEVLPLDLRHEEVTVAHVPVNQLVPEEAPLPTTRQEGDTLIVPVLREIMVKRVLLVEELHVTRHQITTQEPQYVRLRQEHIEVDRLPAANAGTASPTPLPSPES